MQFSLILNPADYLYIIMYFTDNVPALHDVWLIGDNFLKNNIGEFHAARKNALKNRTSSPYLFDNYNVLGFYGSSRWGINRFLNPFIDALNERLHLPKMLVFAYDKDILSNLSLHKIHTGVVLGAVLHYMIKQIDSIIRKCISAIIEKWPGAITQGYPKIIWVRMLKRPGTVDSEFNKTVFENRGKFNSVLEELLLDSRDHRIMSIEVNPLGFNNWGDLTSQGMTDFWKEVDRGLQKFDTNEITINPRKLQQAKKQDHASKVFISKAF